MKRQEETPSKGREEHVDWQVQSSRQDKKWRSMENQREGTTILGKTTCSEDSVAIRRLCARVMGCMQWGGKTKEVKETWKTKARSLFWG